jgi:hypothetical protein
MRTFVAFLIAPLLPAVLPAWYLHANNPDRLAISGYIFLCGLFYLLEVVVGIPACKLFIRMRWRRVWAYMLLGFFGVAVPVIVLSMVRWSEKDSAADLSFSVGYLGLLGASIGLIFWLVARPDRIAESS